MLKWCLLIFLFAKSVLFILHRIQRSIAGRQWYIQYHITGRVCEGTSDLVHIFVGFYASSININIGAKYTSGFVLGLVPIPSRVVPKSCQNHMKNEESKIYFSPINSLQITKIIFFQLIFFRVSNNDDTHPGCCLSICCIYCDC